MEKIVVLITGLNGKIATEIALAVDKDPDMELMQVGLKGSTKPDLCTYMVNDLSIQLFDPDEKEKLVIAMKNKRPDVAIDFSKTSALRENVDFYAKLRVPFIVVTTLGQGDMEYISERIAKYHIDAFAATNLSREDHNFQLYIIKAVKLLYENRNKPEAGFVYEINDFATNDLFV